MATLSEAYAGKDIKMDMEKQDIQINFKNDLRVINYYDNLSQAIINRLKTKQGELTLHPDYGSQLHLLLGKAGNSLILSEAKQYVREALLQEPRIKTINSIKTSFKNNSNRQIIVIEISITPIGPEGDPLDLIWSYFLT